MIEETTREEIKNTTDVIIANKDSRFIAFHNNGHLGSWGFVTKKITPNVDQPTRGDFYWIEGSPNPTKPKKCERRPHQLNMEVASWGKVIGL